MQREITSYRDDSVTIPCRNRDDGRVGRDYLDAGESNRTKTS